MDGDEKMSTHKMSNIPTTVPVLDFSTAPVLYLILDPWSISVISAALPIDAMCKLNFFSGSFHHLLKYCAVIYGELHLSILPRVFTRVNDHVIEFFSSTEGAPHQPSFLLSRATRPSKRILKEVKDYRKGSSHSAVDTLVISAKSVHRATSAMLASRDKSSHGMSGVPPDVPLIDWPAAMEQCSGDLEFLAELLVDLWNESNEHAKSLRKAVAEGRNVQVQHEAHSIKGAAANLMCHRLRTAALTLERTGLAGERGPQVGPEREAILQRMKDNFEVVEKEMLAFEDFLKEKGLL